jgi:hypothetical protein
MEPSTNFHLGAEPVQDFSWPIKVFQDVIHSNKINGLFCHAGPASVAHLNGNVAALSQPA